MEVHERPEIPEVHPQWQDSEDEDAGDMDGGFVTGNYYASIFCNLWRINNKNISDSEAEPDVSSSSEEEDSD